MSRRVLSSSSSTSVADDDDFFDEPSKERESKLPADRSGSTSVSSSSRSYSQRTSRSSNHESSYDPSSRRKSSTEEERQPVNIPSPNYRDSEDYGRSVTSEEDSAGEKQTVKKHDERKKSKSSVSEKGQRRGSSTRNSRRGSLYSTYSSDNEKHHPKDSHSTRPASSSTIKQSERSTGSRAKSAPTKRQNRSRPASGYRSMEQMDVRALLDSVLQTEDSYSRHRPRQPVEVLEYRRRRNYTFSDDRLAAIERENMRLLDKIVMAHDAEPSWVSRSRVATVKPAAFPDVARRRQLDKIEGENVALLRRLQAVQPSPDICRDTLIADYNRRRALYLGGTIYGPPQQINSNQRRRAKSASRAAYCHSAH